MSNFPGEITEGTTYTSMLGKTQLKNMATSNSFDQDLAAKIN